MTNAPEVTTLLERWQDGDETVLDRLIPLLYRELRGLASSQLRKEGSGHTLQPTALVHEAYVKLIGQGPGRIESRRHFFALAAKAMRQVLVDHARRKNAEKRAGGLYRVTLTDALGQPLEVAGPGIDTLDLDRSLIRLAEIRPRAAQVVELRFFGGLTLDQAAEVLGVTQKTVARDWRSARLWLLDRLTPSS